MVQSMTGFGKASGTINNKNFNIEIRSLNSKQTDINVRMPSVYKQYEMGIRKLITGKLYRGKIEFNLNVESDQSSTGYRLDTALAEKYYHDISALGTSIGLSSENILSTLLRLPEVMVPQNVEPDESEWEDIEPIIEEALKNIEAFRLDEGRKLEEELKMRVASILDLLDKVAPFEKQRIESVKARMEKNLAEWVGNEKVDRNRLEQELVYYIEKFDITEEKVRLKTHCDYFIQTLNNESPNGKKLGFISQEMGREINTLGSKSYNADLQRNVVQMKDELEKIKEQVLNIL